jgi:hypothetical protein
MTERSVTRLRVVFFVLLIANVFALAYIVFRSDPHTVARTRIEEVQIRPERMKLLDAATRGGRQVEDAAKAGKAQR